MVADGISGPTVEPTGSPATKKRGYLTLEEARAAAIAYVKANGKSRTPERDAALRYEDLKSTAKQMAEDVTRHRSMKAIVILVEPDGHVIIGSPLDDAEVRKALERAYRTTP